MKNENTNEINRTNGKNSNKRFGLFDKDSGELIDVANLIYCPHRIRIKDFFMGMQDGFENLAKEKLKSEELNVFLFLLSRVDFENIIRVSPNEICEALKMRRGNVSRAMRKLKEKHLIDVGEFHSFKLSSEIGWKGKVQNLRKEQAKQTKLSMNRNLPTKTDLEAENVAYEKLSKFKDSKEG